MPADSYKTFWESYGDTSSFIEVKDKDEGEGSLACRVLDEYRIPYSGTNGGELSGLDILRMDAMTVIRLSLLEHSAVHGGFWEAIVNPEGEVEFVDIGKGISNIGGDVYHTIQTSAYVDKCSGVMVTGRKPMPERLDIQWKLIWGDDKEIYDLNLMHSNCLLKDFTQFATIVFKDPHFATAYEDGIDNLYNIGLENPHDSVLGYAYFPWVRGDGDGLVGPETTISYSDSSIIPIKIGEEGAAFGPYIGVLVNHPTFSEGEEEACWTDQGLEGNWENGVLVPIPDKFRYTSVRGTTVDTFIRISSVIVVGTLLDSVRGQPKTPNDAVNPNPTYSDTEVWVSINKLKTTAVRLEAGNHYTVSYKQEEFKQPYISFANNARREDPALFGSDVYFKIDEFCQYYVQTGKTDGNGTILPLSDVQGIWVQEIWVMAELSTPSIQIYDPRGISSSGQGAALTIAENFEYWAGPIILRDPPAPVAFNGTLLDPVVGKIDHDPTTVQNLIDTPMEEALDIMAKGQGLTLTLSFLDEDQVEKLSESLFDYMNGGDGIVTTYVCGPNANPKLGTRGPAGGIVNEINYSYTDSGSYTISVNEGPRLVGGLSNISGGPVMKQAEEVSTRGTVIQDMGNNIYYKVRTDEIGDRIAINCCRSIIRVGDKVQCSVHNNPVES